MSDFNAHDLSSDLKNQSNALTQMAGSAAKKTGRKLLTKGLKAGSKLIMKILKDVIAVVIKFFVKAIVAFFGWELVLIIVAILAFCIFVSAITSGDWMLGSKKNDSDLLISAEYQKTFIDLSTNSVLPIDEEEASEAWKTTLKSIVQPSWAIVAAFARYEMIRSSGKYNLPNAEKMFNGLEPSYEYKSVKDSQTTRVDKVCYVDGELQDHDTSVTSRDLPSRNILSAVNIPFGRTEIPSVVKYFPGGTYEPNGNWEHISTTTIDDCTTSVYRSYVRTVVDDRGVPNTEFDEEAFKSYVLSKGVKERDIEEFLTYVLAADPNFPIELYKGNLISGSELFNPPTYEFTGEAIEGWVWPIANTPMNVNSYYGARWGRMHNGVDLGGRAYKDAPILAARDGIVIYTGWSDSYGNWAIINHDNDLQTRYAHMSSVSVKTGDEVAAGQQIGVQGSTGRSTGPHLHFEVIQPDPKNPLGRTSNAPKVYDPMIFLGPIKEKGG